MPYVARRCPGLGATAMYTAMPSGGKHGNVWFSWPGSQPNGGGGGFVIPESAPEPVGVSTGWAAPPVPGAGDAELAARLAEEQAARIAAEAALRDAQARRQPAVYVPTSRQYSAPGAFDYSTFDAYRSMLPAAPSSNPLTRRYPLPPSAYPAPSRWAGEDITGETVAASVAPAAIAPTTAPESVATTTEFPWWLLLVAAGLVVLS